MRTGTPMSTGPASPRAAGRCLAVALLSAAATGQALQVHAEPQAQFQAHPQAIQAQPQAQPPAATPGGVFGTIGRFIDEQIGKVTITLKSPPDPLQVGKAGETATTVAKETVGAVVRLPNTWVIDGRERCLMAPNGAPDCLAATERMCKRKGYTTGRSLDIQTAQKCPAEVWIGRSSKDTACTPEAFVTRAVCQ